VLAKFAIDVLTILVIATDYKRTFSELGDMLGTRRLRIKSELIAALQCLKSWKRVGIKPSIASSLSGIRALTADDIV
jgi:hAT family C-terminal dimerisation region